MHDNVGLSVFINPAVGSEHTIYLGPRNSDTEFDLDFSMRDFFIDYSSGGIMERDQAIMLRRNRF
jgi:hypothetical protein